jgi:hypothetical protein
MPRVTIGGVTDSERNYEEIKGAETRIYQTAAFKRAH